MKQSLGAKTVMYPTPVLLVGSYDQQEKPNIMTVAWGGICCSKPPCVNVSLRKATHSYGNLILQQSFTVNILSEDQVKLADYAGMFSGKSEDKFAALDLHPVKSQLVQAPYIQEAPLVLECKLIHTFELGLHTVFIGEILDVKADAAVLGPDGELDMEKLKPIAYAPGLRLYYGFGKPLAKAFSIGNTVKK